MSPITVGTANLNTSVGALQSNTDKVMDRIREFAAAQCTLACFSEQVISGYPAEDLVLWQGFVEEQWRQLERVRKLTAELAHPIIVVLGLTVRYEGANYNCAAVLQKGQVLGIVPKEQLPTYEVFYEKRVYTPGIPGHVGAIGTIPFGDIFFRFTFGTLAVEVCEDLWDRRGPLTRRALSGAELVVNISASPWRAGILETRRALLRQRSTDYEVSIVYVNQIGGQDSLVFDGGSLVGHNGAIIHESPRWQEHAAIFSIDLADVRQRRKTNQAWIQKRDEWIKHQLPYQIIESDEAIPLPAAAIHKASRRVEAPDSTAANRNLPVADPRTTLFENQIAAMKLGLQDYFEKTGAFKKIGVAMSGGKDSALTLILAWLYAKERCSNPADIREFVQAFSMPTRYNSSETRNVAKSLSEELGVGFSELSIEEAFAREEAATRTMLGTNTLDRLTLQNIQARLRGMRMWNWANAAQGLWLQSGNMSEKAVGYTTIGGDLMGGYSLIGNVPKTQVIALLHHFHSAYKIKSLAALLKLQASAELEDDQEDERDLMPFAVLDACFELFAGEKIMPVELYRTLRARWTDDELKALRADYQPGMLKAWVKRFIQLFTRSIYKWVQAPQTVHLGLLDLDRERALQLPAVQASEWLKLDELDREP